MSTIISNYLENSLISIPTITSNTMIKQPEIIQIMREINNVDFLILEEKIKSFFNNALNDNFEIIQVLLICSLMYKNDIFPQFIFDILTELGFSQGLTVQELKQNSENLIDLLLSKTRGGGQRGGQFGKVLKILSQISIVCIAIYTDYFFYSIPLWEKVTDTGTKIIDTVKLLKVGPEKTCNVQVPDSIVFFNKYFVKKDENVDFLNIYRTTTCIANRWMDTYLEDEVFMPQQFEEGKIHDEYSKALVLVQDKSSPVSEQLMLQIQPIEQHTENIIRGLVIYDETQKQINIEKTKTLLKTFIQMPDEELFNLLNPKNPQQETIPEKRTSSTIFSLEGVIEFGVDSLTLFKNVLQNIKPMTQENMALDITTTYSRLIKDYCTLQLRNIEDLQKKSKRNLEDFITQSSRLVEDIIDFIKWLPTIYLLNSLAIGIILNFLKELIKKSDKNPQSTIENSELENKNSQLTIENPTSVISNKGGKLKKYNKTRKTKKIKTKKNKKIKRKRQTKKNKNH